MPFAGNAWLALWNDIVPEREGEYDDWHTREHVPERVGVPGFRSGRRYVDRTRDTHRYFTLYELDDLSALERAEYRALVDTPTATSAAMRPDFRNFVRAPCRVVASVGFGIGGAIACVRIDGTHDKVPLDTLLALPGVIAAHRGRVEATPAGPAWTPSRPNADPAPSFAELLLVEAIDRDRARTALGAWCSDAAAATRSRDAAVYDLAFVFPGPDPGERVRRQRPGVAPDALQDPAG